MIRYTLMFAAMLTASLTNTTTFAEENLGTPEQRAACTPDAFRLCSAYIPDPAGVEACLKLRKSDLSEACKAVFEQATSGSSRSR
jgi:hypothetical protein